MLVRCDHSLGPVDAGTDWPVFPGFAVSPEQCGKAWVGVPCSAIRILRQSTGPDDAPDGTPCLVSTIGEWDDRRAM